MNFLILMIEKFSSFRNLQLYVTLPYIRGREHFFRTIITINRRPDKFKIILLPTGYNMCLIHTSKA